MRSIGWLHFTDLHQGLGPQGWLWPNVREILLADLTELHKRCGPWDLVLFSGDLTQRGSVDEFTGLNATLTQLWEHLRLLGSTPSLLVVPGNHDLVRPEERRAEHALARWTGHPEMQDEFWCDPNSSFRLLVSEMFTNFSAWHNDNRFCALDRRPGLLPGDFSSVLTKDGLRLGIVGLNSSFLQLSDTAVQGNLAVDVRQFHAACDGDGPAWAKNCDFAMVMTHHPPEWLSPDSREDFFAEIAPPDRFVAHVFGHMHEHEYTSLSVNGSNPRRQIQGSALFGLESFGKGKCDRRHGYAAGRITVNDRDEANLRLWPRIAQKTPHVRGHWRIVQDIIRFELQDDHGTRPETLRFKCSPSAPATGTRAKADLLTDLIKAIRCSPEKLIDRIAEELKQYGRDVKRIDKLALQVRLAPLLWMNETRVVMRANGECIDIELLRREWPSNLEAHIKSALASLLGDYIRGREFVETANPKLRTLSLHR